MEETKARFSKRFHHTRLDAIRQYIRQILPSFLLGLLCSLAALPFGLVPFGVAAAATRSNSRSRIHQPLRGRGGRLPRGRAEAFSVHRRVLLTPAAQGDSLAAAAAPQKRPCRRAERCGRAAGRLRRRRRAVPFSDFRHCDGRMRRAARRGFHLFRRTGQGDIPAKGDPADGADAGRERRGHAARLRPAPAADGPRRLRRQPPRGPPPYSLCC